MRKNSKINTWKIKHQGQIEATEYRNQFYAMSAFCLSWFGMCVVFCFILVISNPGCTLESLGESLINHCMLGPNLDQLNENLEIGKTFVKKNQTKTKQNPSELFYSRVRAENFAVRPFFLNPKIVSSFLQTTWQIIFKTKFLNV